MANFAEHLRRQALRRADRAARVARAKPWY
jgi:hypothetical protein